MAQPPREIDVRKIAALARLTLGPDEAERFKPQLRAILDHIAEIDTLNTEGIEPTSHVIPLSTPVRPDEVRQGLHRDEALSQAPRTAEGAFVVPQFVEGG